MELRDQILELLPENSPCRYPETGVSVIDEVRDVFRDLASLVDQIHKSNPVDDHGHNLKMNAAFIACTRWVMKSKPDPEEEKLFRDSLTGDKFWIGIPSDGSLPIVHVKYTDINMVRKVVELVDSMDTPLQINPDGTTKWIIGTARKGKRKNVITLKQLQDAVGGSIELSSCYIDERIRWMYVNEDGRSLNLPLNVFASAANGLSDIVGSVVLMPNRRRD